MSIFDICPKGASHLEFCLQIFSNIIAWTTEISVVVAVVVEFVADVFVENTFAVAVTSVCKNEVGAGCILLVVLVDISLIEAPYLNLTQGHSLTICLEKRCFGPHIS